MIQRANRITGFDFANPKSRRSRQHRRQDVRHRLAVRGPAADRRCIPPGFVARRLHTPGVRAPRALPDGRLDAC